MALLQSYIVLLMLSIFFITACPRTIPSAPASGSGSCNMTAPAPTSSGSGSGTMSRGLLIIVTIVIALVVVVSLIVVLFFVTKWGNEPPDDRVAKSWDSQKWRLLQEGDIMFNPSELFSAKTRMLVKIQAANKSAYKAKLKNGNAVVIKRLGKVVQGRDVFEHHIDRIAGVTDAHIVPLRGFIYKEEKSVLVYDFMPMGSLYDFLHVCTTPLEWRRCWIIALGAARGVARIHKRGLLHGKIKSSNILFGHLYDVRVSENSLFDLMAPSEKCPSSRDKDVHDFGLVLLELLSRRRVGNLRQLIDRNMIDGYLKQDVDQGEAVEQHINEFLAPELAENQAARKQIVQLLLLAMDCTDDSPSMIKVVKRINNARPLMENTAAQA